MLNLHTILADVRGWRELLFFLMMTILVGCAAQGNPGGGPTDRQGPQILNTDPQDGATRVSTEPEIRLLFSEPIDNRLSSGVLQVTPLPAIAPQLKIRRKSITVRLNEPLKPDQTYIFNFGRNLKDFQGNATAQEIKLAFTTGDSLDEGIISGQITAIPAQQKTAVWFFRKKGASFPDTLWKETPDFIAAVDDKGHYRATNLPVGEFRALAVAGENPRPRFLAENELLAPPQSEPLVISSRRDHIANVDFRLTKQYLKPFRLLTANPLAGSVELNFSRPLDDVGLQPRSFVFSDESIAVHTAWISPDQPSRVVLLTDSLTPQMEYQIAVANLLAENFDSLSTGGRQAKFIWQARVDTLCPTIVSCVPGANSKNIEPDVRIRIELSEPIAGDTLIRDINLFTRDTVAVPVSSSWFDANTIVIEPCQPLPPAAPFRLQIETKHWRDAFGNFFRDSVAIVQFTTIDQNLFGSVVGKVTSVSVEKLHELVITATLSGEAKFERHTRPDSTGHYQFRELWPGKYTFAIWHDRNSDGQYDFGRLMPYRPAEPYRLFPDVINVRSRWETAEVNWEF